MKTNKEFIEGIYQKADEISNEKKQRNKNYIRTISSIAAVLIIVIALGININDTKLQQKNPAQKDFQNEEKTISLKTVENFENFCTIVKENKDENKIAINGAYSDGMTESLTYSSNSYDSSETNNQVENVEEADIVKINQNYIYYITEKKVVIVDAKSAEETEKIFEIDYSEENIWPQEMFVNENKLIVIARKYGTNMVTCGNAYRRKQYTVYC